MDFPAITLSLLAMMCSVHILQPFLLRKHYGTVQANLILQTTYLTGIAVGSIVLAPISETYGRKWVYCICMTIFVILLVPCAKATSLSEIIVLRFFAALAGSAMVANAPGTIADIVGDEYRATVSDTTLPNLMRALAGLSFPPTKKRHLREVVQKY